MKLNLITSLGILLIQLFFLNSPHQVAYAKGNGSGGGGDLMMISQEKLIFRENEVLFRASFVRNYISDEKRGLKRDLLNLIDSLNSKQVHVVTSKLPAEFASIRDVLTSGKELFKADVIASKWMLSEKDVYAWCDDVDGKVKDAATCGKPLRGEKPSPVVFNYHRISRYDVSRKELRKKLIQLAFHEHVRHFGFPDNNNDLAQLAGVMSDNDALVSFADSDKQRLSIKRSILIVTRAVRAQGVGRVPSITDSGRLEWKGTLLKTDLGMEPAPSLEDAYIDPSFESSDSRLGLYIDLLHITSRAGFDARGISIEELLPSRDNFGVSLTYGRIAKVLREKSVPRGK